MKGPFGKFSWPSTRCDRPTVPFKSPRTSLIQKSRSPQTQRRGPSTSGIPRIPSARVTANAEMLNNVDRIRIMDPAPPLRSSRYPAALARTPVTQNVNSLFQLNLKTRMFDFPLSYMIYSDSFSAIGPMSKTRIRTRVAEILSETPSETDASTFSHLTPELRKSLETILIETHPMLSAKLNSPATTRD